MSRTLPPRRWLAATGCSCAIRGSSLSSSLVSDAVAAEEEEEDDDEEEEEEEDNDDDDSSPLPTPRRARE
jgi:hypothetical protein